MQHRIVLATVGSLGDLHPFIALGLALRGAGVSVTVACADEYRDKVESAGLVFHSMRPSFAQMQADLRMTRAELTKAILARNDFLFRKVVLPYARPAYADMTDVLRGADLLLSSSLAFGARFAAEQSGTPWFGIVLQPSMFLSAHDPPVLPPVEGLSAVLRRLGPGPAAIALRVVKFGLGRLLAPLEDLRRELGLPATVGNVLFEGQYSSLGAIGLYSAVLGGVQPDYPRPTSVVGFATFDADAVTDLGRAGALNEFLDAGGPPLVFTLGSLIVNSPGAFYRESAAAARALGRRAVLLVGEDAVAAHADLRGADIFVCGYAPHSVLFARAAAIVHHGGIGTLAQALRAGRPQLVVPFYADQADNARRAVGLGLARSLVPARYRAAAVRRELSLLLDDVRYAREAARRGGTVRLEDGARHAAALVLKHLSRGGNGGSGTLR